MSKPGSSHEKGFLLAMYLMESKAPTPRGLQEYLKDRGRFDVHIRSCQRMMVMAECHVPVGKAEL